MEKKKGISEKGMDEDVHDFANNMPEVPRLSYPRSEAAPQNNGVSKNSHPAFANSAIGAYAQRQDRPFTHNDGVSAYNGSGPGTFPPIKDEPIAAYSQREAPGSSGTLGYNDPEPDMNVKVGAYVTKKGISEKGIDEDVHDFANNIPEVPRLSYPRSEVAHSANGSGAKAHPAFHNDAIGAYAQGPAPQ